MVISHVIQVKEVGYCGKDLSLLAELGKPAK